MTKAVTTTTKELRTKPEPTFQDDDLLNDRQKKAIPVLAEHDVLSQGVRELDRQGIISWTQFWNVWRRNPHFYQHYIRERNRVQGETAEMLYQKVDEYRVAIVKEELRIAFCDEDSKFVMHKQKAIDRLLAILGVDTGEKANIAVNIRHEIRDKQQTFREFIEQVQRERHGQAGLGIPEAPDGGNGNRISNE